MTAGWPLVEKPHPFNRAASAAAAEVRALVGQEAGVALDVDALCRHGRFFVSEADLGAADGGIEGVLCPGPDDSFIVEVDPRPKGGWRGTPAHEEQVVRRRRWRFRVCHEVGHSTQFRRQPGQRPALQVQGNARREQFCDEFARALLVPESVAGSVAPVASSVTALRDRFDVSLEVAARALAAAQPDIAFAIWWWPAGHDADQRLLQQWASFDDAEAFRLWRSSELLTEALKTGTAEGLLPLDQDTVSATLLRLDDSRQVVAVAERG